MRTKLDKESFAYARRWQKFIRDDKRELPTGCSRTTLVAYATFMMVAGSNGLDCYVSDGKMAEYLWCNRDTAAKCRHAALDLEWFVPNGVRHGRTEGLNINIPGQGTSIAEPTQQSPRHTVTDPIPCSTQLPIAEPTQQSIAEPTQHYQVTPKGVTSVEQVETDPWDKVGCQDPGCPQAGAWHQHMTEDMMADAAKERRQDDDEPKPKHKAAPSEPTRPRAWEDI